LINKKASDFAVEDGPLPATLDELTVGGAASPLRPSAPPKFSG
jgi:hypothetical protein